MNNKIIAFLEIKLGKVLCALLTVLDTLICMFISKSGCENPTQKIIFVKFIEQGALVLHLPTFLEAANRYGKENIFIVTFQSNAALLEILDCFVFSNQFYLSEKNIVSFSFSFFGVLKKIRRSRIDSLIDLEFFSCATAIFSYLSGATKRVGYHRYQGGQNYRGDLFTHKHNYSHYLNVGDTSKNMLDSLETTISKLPALPLSSIVSIAPFIFIPTAEDLQHAKNLFDATISFGNCVIINPSFKDVLPLRAWPISNYERLVQKLQEEEKNYTFLFTGREDEYQDTENFLNKFPAIKALNLCGKTTLRMLFTLYSTSKLLITSDSGPAHFASLTPIPTIVFFGPETPILYAPRASNIHVLYKQLPCSPCYNVYNNRLSDCKNNLCLKAILVEDVVELALKILRDEISKTQFTQN